jgi:hypothetical protein
VGEVPQLLQVSRPIEQPRPSQPHLLPMPVRSPLLSSGLSGLSSCRLASEVGRSGTQTSTTPTSRRIFGPQDGTTAN